MAVIARRSPWSVWLLALCLIAPPAARAATVVRLRDRDLAATADAIVTGTVRALESVAPPRGGSIQTLVTLAIEEVLAGGVRADQMVLVEPGGRVGDRERRLFGAPSYRMGERVLVFLEQRPDGAFRTAHLALGKFAVVWDRRRQEAVAVRDLGATRVLSPDALGGLAARRDPRRSAERFLRHLRRWARRASPLQVPPVTSPRLSSDPGLEHQAIARFTRLGDGRWFEPDAGLPVFFQLARTDPTLGVEASQRALLGAYRAWTDVPTAAIILRDGGATAPRPASACDGENRVTFDDPFAEITDPRNCGGVLAVGGYCSTPERTVVGGVQYTRIFEADVTFNNGFEGCRFWTEANVAEVATHELGHTIGLGHSSSSSPEPDATLREATMYFMAHFDGRGAALRTDDVAGVSALYPAGEPAPPPPPDEGAPPSPNPRPDPGPPPGDPCGDGDLDGDGVADACDNCVLFPNPRQRAADACVSMTRARVAIRFGGGSRSRRDRLSLKAILPPQALDGTPGRLGSTLTLIGDGEVLYTAHLGRGSLRAVRGGSRFLYFDRRGEQTPGLVKLLLARRSRGDVRLIALVRHLDLGGRRPGALLVRFGLGGDNFVAALECSSGASRRSRRLRCR